MTTSTNAEVSLPLPPTYKFPLLVSTIRSQVATVGQNPLYASTPSVQSAATNLTTAVTALDGTLTSHGNAVALVATLEGQRAVQISDVVRLHGGLVAALDLASNGDPQAALAWTGKIKTRSPATSTTDPPSSPLARPVANVSGEIQVSCKSDPQAKLYLFQTGADPTHPELWAAPAMVGRCKYVLGGQTPGAKLYFRIAIFRRVAGQGAWSDVLSVTVK